MATNNNSGGGISDWGLSKDKDSFWGNFNPLFLAGGPIGWLAGAASASYKTAGDYQKKAENTVNQQITDLGSWYKKESGKSYLDTEAMQSALGQLRTTISQNLMVQGNQLRSGGGTAEAALAGRTNAAETFSNAITRLIGGQTDRKDQLWRDYQYRMQNWQNAKPAMQQQQAGNSANIGGDLIALPFDKIDSIIKSAGSASSGAGDAAKMAAMVA